MTRLIVSVLPHGPTAFFKVSNVVPSADVYNHGKVTAHQPEIILNNFNTRLGHRVGRFLGSFFPHVRNNEICLFMVFFYGDDIYRVWWILFFNFSVPFFVSPVLFLGENEWVSE